MLENTLPPVMNIPATPGRSSKTRLRPRPARAPGSRHARVQPAGAARGQARPGGRCVFTQRAGHRANLVSHYVSKIISAITCVVTNFTVRMLLHATAHQADLKPKILESKNLKPKIML